MTFRYGYGTSDSLPTGMLCWNECCFGKLSLRVLGEIFSGRSADTNSFSAGAPALCSLVSTVKSKVFFFSSGLICRRSKASSLPRYISPSFWCKASAALESSESTIMAGPAMVAG